MFIHIQIISVKRYESLSLFLFSSFCSLSRYVYMSALWLFLFSFASECRIYIKSKCIDLILTRRIELKCDISVFTMGHHVSEIRILENILQSVLIHWNLSCGTFIQNPNTSKTLKLLLRPEHGNEHLPITLWRIQDNLVYFDSLYLPYLH